MSRRKSGPWESFLYQPPSWFEPLKWERVFPPLAPENSASSPRSGGTGHHPTRIQNPESNTESVHVDLGAGDGGFVTACADECPEIRFVAVERLLGRARKIAKKAHRLRLKNLRALRIEAAYAVEHLFPPASVAAITILFPDPWPKRRHHKNRLIQTTFLERCARCLRPDGWLAIKTDDACYFEQILRSLTACRGLRHWNAADPKVLLPSLTEFEREHLRAGRTIHFVAARLS